MSVIQSIQEKYAKLMAIIIALALIIFVVMLAFENGGSLFRGGNTTSVGKVNGKGIEVNSFLTKVDQEEEYMKSQGYPAGAGLRQQAIDRAWDREVNRLLMSSELSKLNMEIGKREIGDLLYGPNAPDDLKQQFTDPKTGFYNAQLAKQQIDEMLKKGTAEQKAQFNAYVSNLEFNRLNEKYVSLLTNSSNTPRWLVERQNADNSLLAKISYVRETYSSINDSLAKVSDQEIKDYINKHKDDYKQEESRGISYVAFSALPTGVDTANTLRDVLAIKPEMDSTTDVEGVLNRYASAIPMSESYYSKTQLQTANQQMGLGSKDTILTLAKNAVYGPYLDGDSYVLAKMIDSKIMPDSVKCRHVLVGTDLQQGGVADSIASRKIDSVENAIKGGASWAAMVDKYNPPSDGSRQQQGEMTFSSTQIQNPNFAPEFAKFILEGKPGDRKKVKTSFGWHYIEILAQIKPQMHYKVAYFAKKIEAGQETESNANNEATVFASNSRDQKSFDASAEKLKAQGINKLVATDILPTASLVPGLGISRPFVKSIYEAKRGEVLQPARVGENWVVALVSEVNEEGIQSVNKARPAVEPLLINHKKAEIITKKIGTISTLDAAATALGGKPIDVADSIRMTGSQVALNGESKVVGAAFNPANKGKLVNQAIEGMQGVYVVRVDNVSATALVDANVADQRRARYQQAKMSGAYPLQALKEDASIKDNRRKVF